jgi:hypothetical protein
MRTAGRRIGGGALAVGLLVAAAAGADPAPLPPIAPSAKKLRDETDGLARDREQVEKDLANDKASADERARLRSRLLELVEQLKAQRAAPPAALAKGKEAAPSPKPKFDLPAGNSIDAVRLATNLYRADEVPSALSAFRAIETEKLSREDRAFVQYMTACCLRKLGKLTDATVIYRELANAKDDPLVSEYAVWQLNTLSSMQELETQLEQLRTRRKAW